MQYIICVCFAQNKTLCMLFDFDKIMFLCCVCFFFFFLTLSQLSLCMHFSLVYTLLQQLPEADREDMLRKRGITDLHDPAPGRQTRPKLMAKVPIPDCDLCKYTQNFGSYFLSRIYTFCFSVCSLKKR